MQFRQRYRFVQHRTGMFGVVVRLRPQIDIEGHAANPAVELQAGTPADTPVYSFVRPALLAIRIRNRTRDGPQPLDAVLKLDCQFRRLVDASPDPVTRRYAGRRELQDRHFFRIGSSRTEDRGACPARVDMHIPGEALRPVCFGKRKIVCRHARSEQADQRTGHQRKYGGPFHCANSSVWTTRCIAWFAVCQMASGAVSSMR